MFRHLLKLIWKRKSRNLMLSLEILLAFVIVFAVTCFAVRNYQLYQLPIGFDHRDVWTADIKADNEHGAGGIDAAVYDQLKRGLEALPEVENVGFVGFSPFTRSTMRTEFNLPGNGRRVSADMSEISDDAFALSGIKIVEGRAFSAEDEGAPGIPVVINRSMAELLFPGVSAVGKQFTDSEAETRDKRMLKVVGVVDEYRNQGELMNPVNFILMRFSPLSSKDSVWTIMLKVKPGTGRAFEAKLSERLKSIRNDWSYEISPLDALRASMLKSALGPLIAMAVVAVFMLVMVAFGLFGVLWQNTTQRIPEIGLRRALGASAGHIYRQIIAEQLLLSSVAMLAALLLLVQLPITGAFGDSLGWDVFLLAAALSMAVIYLISLLCSIYPGWRAARLSPTEALHYE
ncbi:ABC transporter permease [Massilia glaciei]|uniref:ABC transporter permease n=1 Tax=Massilia glaciei TaxID=1524097 RepID=A0A2U2HLP5_9BURK|nr:FtsX-like permease family protein [Massilia glaciei]PWF48430.1 ABC transporter permease [Massilia glaciei]